MTTPTGLAKAHQISRRMSLKLVAGATALVLLAGGAGCSSMGGEGSSQTAAITQGQKIVMATHSFNVFIGPQRARTATATIPAAEANAGPLAKLAAERGKQGQEFLAVQMIGGSTPMQHWNQGDGDDTKNIAKAALLKGGDSVTVFTMSPNAKMPEEGIDKFGDFIIAHNKNARIMVQNSWLSYDGVGSLASVGGSGANGFTNADHDKMTAARLDELIADGDQGVRGTGYAKRLREQLDGIDKRAGKQITYVVPSGPAVYELRKQIIAGRVPGVAKQSDIFTDALGHPQPPLSHLVTYVWYAAMYRENPVGLQALVDSADPTSASREKMLQQIAWNAVIAEPKSGVKGKPVHVGG